MDTAQKWLLPITGPAQTPKQDPKFIGPILTRVPYKSAVENIRALNGDPAALATIATWLKYKRDGTGSVWIDHYNTARNAAKDVSLLKQMRRENLARLTSTTPSKPQPQRSGAPTPPPQTGAKGLQNSAGSKPRPERSGPPAAPLQPAASKPQPKRTGDVSIEAALRNIDPNFQPAKSKTATIDIDLRSGLDAYEKAFGPLFGNGHAVAGGQKQGSPGAASPTFDGIRVTSRPALTLETIKLPPGVTRENFAAFMLDADSYLPLVGGHRSHEGRDYLDFNEAITRIAKLNGVSSEQVFRDFPSNVRSILDIADRKNEQMVAQIQAEMTAKHRAGFKKGWEMVGQGALKTAKAPLAGIGNFAKFALGTSIPSLQYVHREDVSDYRPIAPSETGDPLISLRNAVYNIFEGSATPYLSRKNTTAAQRFDDDAEAGLDIVMNLFGGKLADGPIKALASLWKPISRKIGESAALRMLRRAGTSRGESLAKDLVESGVNSQDAELISREMRDVFDSHVSDNFGPRQSGQAEMHGPVDPATPSSREGLKRTLESKRVVLDSAVRTDVATNDHLYLIGKRVRSAKDIGKLVQMYRNPGHETIRFFYTKKGKIVGQIGYAGRLPSVSPYHTSGRYSELLSEIESEISRLDADGVWVQHNHPSGDPTPSLNDREFQTVLQNDLKEKYKGQIIIDHDRFSYLRNKGVGAPFQEGEEQVIKRKVKGPDPFLRPTSHPVMNKHIGSSRDIADVGFALQATTDRPVLIGIGADAKVRGLLSFDGDLVNTVVRKSKEAENHAQLRLVGTIRRFARGHGTPTVYLLISDEMFDQFSHGRHHWHLQGLVDLDLIQGVVTTKGRILTLHRSKGHYVLGSPKPLKARQSQRR